MTQAAKSPAAAAPSQPLAPTFRRDGTVMDMADLKPGDVDFAEMAAGLSKIARWNGRYACAAYSAAQNAVFVADALFAESGDSQLAACGLLHESRAYLIGDPQPSTTALVALLCAQALRGENYAPDFAERAGQAVHDAIATVHGSIDRAIFGAARIDYPRLYPLYVRQVKDMADRVQRAAGIALFGRKAGPHLPAARRPAPRLTQAIEPWGAAKAELAFLDRLERYLGIVVRPA